MDGGMIRVDFARSAGPLRPIWRSIGYDEINWTYTPRGRSLYETLGQIFGGPLAVRNHNAFTSGNGLSSPAWGSTNLYHETDSGQMCLDWTWSDQIYDVFVERECVPIVELGFMPRDLSSHPSDLTGYTPGRGAGGEPYESRAWTYPPKSYTRWREFCQAFVAHLVDRYGPRRIREWRFEVWNEPDIPHYWRGSCEEYCQLYEASVAGVTAALGDAQVGGPATTDHGPEFLARVLDRVSRLDFASFHSKGAYYSVRRNYNPLRPPPREAPSLARMLHDIERNTAIIRDRFPNIPILVDECDPAVGTIYGVFDNPSFVVSNSTYYPTMLCALAAKLLDMGHIDLFTSWAFYFEGKRWFEGNRALVTNANVELPVLDGFRMLERLGDRRASASVDGADAGLGVLAGDRAAILYNHVDAWWEAGATPVTVQLEHAGTAVRFWGLGDSYSCWLGMGSPQNPTDEQTSALRRAAGLKLLAIVPTTGGRVVHTVEVPQHQAVLCEIVP